MKQKNRIYQGQWSSLGTQIFHRAKTNAWPHEYTLSLINLQLTRKNLLIHAEAPRDPPFETIISECVLPARHAPSPSAFSRIVFHSRACPNHVAYLSERGGGGSSSVGYYTRVAQSAELAYAAYVRSGRRRASRRRGSLILPRTRARR